MTTQENIVQNIKFYEYRNTYMWLAVVYNKQWKNYSIHLTRKYSYSKIGQTKLDSNTIYLSINAVAGLIKQLLSAYHYAKQLEEENGIKLFNI